MSETYLLALDARVQTLSSTRGFSTLVRETLSALEVKYVSTSVVSLVANTDVEVSLGPITQIQLLAVKSSVDCQISLTPNTTPVWSLPTRFALLVLPTTDVAQLLLRGSANGNAEVVLAGR